MDVAPDDLDRSFDQDEQDSPVVSAPVARAPITRSNDRGTDKPERAERGSERFQRPIISDLLREGQEIIVQIAKEPIGQKGARITSHVALPAPSNGRRLAQGCGIR